MMISRIEFLGCPVDNLTLGEVLDWMDTRIKNREPGKILVLNANKLWLMSRNSRLDQIMKKADLIIPEWAIYWGAKTLGVSLRACVFGIALAKATLPWAKAKGYRLFFLGARPEVVEKLAVKLHEEYPGLQIAGYHHGYLDQAETQKVIVDINQTRPDVLLVAMGSPRQEYWMAENSKSLRVSICMGVGGSFDVLAGVKKDTPTWARGNGLEWLYRLSHEPKVYWKRYLICNPWFVWQVIRKQAELMFQRNSESKQH
jgi:N-acetylglucosaminyldiphosphoundecaprenol N-acetyl-beta-D-mannosaminyltransferase